MAARYGRDAPAINGGITWRVFDAKPDATGAFRLVKEDHAAAPTFILPPGSYVVDASLGLANAAKAVQLRAETVRETFDIPAGAMRLEGRVGDARIPPGQISFEVYAGSQFDATERRPTAQNVMTGDVVLLPEGTYNIVSNYGDGNSVVRSDVIGGAFLIAIGILIVTGYIGVLAVFLIGPQSTMPLNNQLNFLIALFAGVLTFLSPCILPVLPAYFSYMAGTTSEEVRK